MYYLYSYTNSVNEKCYIGVTSDLTRRKRDHAKGCSGASAFNRAIKKYNIDTFIFRILAILDNADEAMRTEQAAIEIYKTLSPNGYNLRAGAPYTLYTGSPSEETRTKMSIAHRSSEKAKNHLSEINSNPELKKQLIERNKSRKGIPLSLELRQKLSNISKGRKFSEETRKKISIANKGKTRSIEQRQKNSLARKGIPLSEEHRTSLSLAQRSSIKSKEHLIKLHIANIGQHLKPHENK